MSCPLAAAPTTSWSKSLLSTLHRYQQQGLYCDTILEAGGSFFKAHMCVVTSACPLLYPEVSSNDGNFYRVKVSLSSADMSCVLHYIYTGALPSGLDSQITKAFQELGLTLLPMSQWSVYLAAYLHQYQRANLLCDVSLLPVSGDAITAHACVLSAASSTFESLIPSQNPSVFMVETSISAITLQVMVQYLYTGQIGDLTECVQETYNHWEELGFAYMEFMFGGGSAPRTQRGKIRVTPCAQNEGRGTTPNSQTGIRGTTLCAQIKGKGTNPCSSTGGRGTIPRTQTGLIAMNSNFEPGAAKAAITSIDDIAQDINDDADEDVDDDRQHKECPPIDTGEEMPETFPPDSALSNKRMRVKEGRARGTRQGRGGGRGRGRGERRCRGKPKQTAETGEDLSVPTAGADKPLRLACTFCPKLFKNQKSLEIHERQHTGIRPYGCQACDKTFTSEQNLKSHEKQHQSGGHICDICGKSFPDPTGLRKHLRRHQNQTLYMCKLCGKALGDPNSLRHHEEGVHYGIKNLLCQFCGKIFRGMGNLRAHERVHTGEKPYVCGSCGQAFTTQSTMRRHELIHKGEKPWTCSMCGKSFTQRSTMKLHEMTHLNERPHQCDVCQKTFIQLYDLKKHQLIHLGLKPYKCNDCGKPFRDHSHLKRHQKTFKGSCSWSATKSERTGKGPPYICQICKKSFTKQSNLNRHNLVHSGEKPFTCQDCGRSFRQMGTLKSHQKTHGKRSGENLDKREEEIYFCHLCKKTFHKLSLFRKHEQIHQETDGVEEGEGIYMNAIADREYILPDTNQYHIVLGVE